ncbi:hypothetical protein T12_20 [Trichinella patagoniensis]|uniref:Uncharacterized protein n=1 Tax=Trichinella patagoniensis TaxID=990121 RepID=A0A0V0Y3X0_9BILA|nr:hypothetical protein T12_20 [Trichinella patagoniensis]
MNALTALGKDPRKGGLREGELSAAEITIAISRDRLPTPVRIKWDEKTSIVRLRWSYCERRPTSLGGVCTSFLI